MKNLITKLRIWGLKGAVNYLLAEFRKRRLRRFFRMNAAEFPITKSQIGITVIGNLSSKGSLNKTLRDFCFSLKDAGIPFQTFDTGANEVPSEDIAAILTPRGEFRIRKYSDVVEMINSPLQAGIVDRISRIGFWEFESGFLEAFPTYLERGGDVIAMSDFNAEYFRRLFNAKRDVHKLLYPLRIETDGVLSKTECRRKFGFHEDDFIVFYNFSFSSGYGRKNPEAAITAFAKAFRCDLNARLVFKTFSLRDEDDLTKQLEEKARQLGVGNRVKFISDYLTQKDVFNLTNACDVYLSLHRSEGFGIGIAEAMSLAKAVVVTDYSSTTEFCNADNSVPVPYRMARMECPDTPLYIAAEDWAEPDVDAAAAALVRLRDDAEFRRSLGDAAQRSIREQFSTEKFRKSVLSFLRENDFSLIPASPSKPAAIWYNILQ